MREDMAKSPPLISHDHQKFGGVMDFFARFRRDESGITAVTFGVMFTVILLSSAIAIDFARGFREKSRMQWAVDAATLAASTKMGLPDQDVAGADIANKFLAANILPGSPATISSVTYNAAEGSVTATVNSSLPTTLMHQFGYDSMNTGASSKVVKGSATIEVAMVLDNSGSMSGDMESLKTAATDLTGILFAGASGADKVKIGLVPFAASVKVGSGYQNSGWIDTDAVSSIHSENFDVTKSRFDLFDDLGVAWAGCVESRPGVHDTTDSVPLNSNPDTMFVPIFAPDEPDDTNASAAGYNSYTNNYISDYGGTCPTPEQTCVKFNKKKNTCSQYAPVPIDIAVAQSRTCKYSGATIDSGSGPNYMCTTRPILPLTSTQADVEAAITGLIATGNTNIGEGTMWGWRLLSPSAPFTEGRSYNDPVNKKVLIVMTDGENTYSATDNHNLSRYGASGFASKGRLGTDYTSTSYTGVMNTKLQTACGNAKAAGITVYTIAFGGGVDAVTQALLTGCASEPGNYFPTSSGAALISAFQNIGRAIADLRVAN